MDMGMGMITGLELVVAPVAPYISVDGWAPRWVMVDTENKYLSDGNACILDFLPLLYYLFIPNILRTKISSSE